jgi:hypothetical protein
MSARWAFVIDGTKQILLVNSNDGVQALTLADRYIVISCDGTWGWASVDLTCAEQPEAEGVSGEGKECGLPMQVFNVLASRVGTLEAEKIIEQIAAEMRGSQT